jgi:hypothetical protein
LFLQSADFSTTWSQIQVAVSTNVTTSPSGDVTADKVVPNLASTISRVSQTFTLTGSHSMSVFAKSSEWGWLFIGPISGGVGVWFDLSNGTVGTQSSGFVGSIVSFGNGWYKCAVSFTGATTSQPARIVPTNADNTITIGDGTSGIFIWGAQLEAGSFATSYIPTVASSVVRSADVCSITGANFTSFYNSTEGSVFIGAVPYAPQNHASNQFIIDIGDGASTNRTRLFRTFTSGLSALAGTSSNVTALSITGASSSTLALSKFAFGMKLNDFALSKDGVLSGTDTTANMMAATTTMTIGNSSVSATQTMNGTIAAIRYYKKRLPNAKLQSLTA